MADELRIPAEIVDKFSAPLKAFRDQLRGTGKDGAEHSDVLTKGFARVETAIHGTGRAASTVLNPALATVGVTSLTTGAALAGITAALNGVTRNLSGIGQLSRDTGIAAKTLQEFGGVASRFGITQDQVAAGAQSFADKMRVFSRGQGELWKWTLEQGTNGKSREAFQSFATDLARTADEGEKLKKALAFGEGIKDPRSQRIFFEQFFGNGDLSRIAQGQLGKVSELFDQFRKKAGPFDPKSVEQAEAYDRAIRDLKGSMQTIGTVIAREVLPYVSGLAHYLDEAVKGERGPAIEALRKGLSDFSGELNKIDWKTFGDDAKVVLKGLLDGLVPLAAELRKVIEAYHAVQSGDLAGALRITTGGGGTLGRIVNQVAPRENTFTRKDEELDAQMRGLPSGGVVEAERLRAAGRRVPEIEARQAEIGAKLSQFGLLEKSGTVSDRARQQADDLRRELSRLTEELKRFREGGASVAKSSADGDGLFGGARVQSAAFGGGLSAGVRYGNGYTGPRAFGGPGGGSGPGYVGERGEAGIGAGGGMPRLTGPILDPNSEGGRRAEAFRRSGGAGGPVTGVPDSVDMTDAERNTLGLIMKYESHGQNTTNYEGRRQGLDPNTAKGSTAQGYYQILNSNWRRLAPGLGIKTSNAMSASLEDQTRVALALLRASRGNPKDWVPFNPALRAAIARGERAPVGTVPSLRPLGPDGTSDPNFFPNGIPRVLKPNSMRDDPSVPGFTMEQAERIRAMREAAGRRPDVLADAGDERRKPGSDGFWTDEEDRKAVRDLGIAFRARRAQEAERNERMQIDSARLSEAAAKAGVVGANVRGDVTNIIKTADPKTTISSVTTGNLFGKPVTVNGRTMGRPED